MYLYERAGCTELKSCIDFRRGVYTKQKLAVAFLAERAPEKRLIDGEREREGGLLFLTFTLSENYFDECFVLFGSRSW